MLKGVEAVAIHGSKCEYFLAKRTVPSAWSLSTQSAFLIRFSETAQDEREYAIKSFKSGAKDVMVASGVASKVSRPCEPPPPFFSVEPSIVLTYRSSTVGPGL